MGGNGGPPLHDPRTLEQVFPGLSSAPGGAIIAVADNVLGLSNKAQEITTDAAMRQVRSLIQEMRELDPVFRVDILEPGGFPATSEGQSNLINRLRLERAKNYYAKGELRPLQVESLRFLQRRVDEAYEIGLRELEAGRLGVRLSMQEALGNFVDARVRGQLRRLHATLGIPVKPGQSVQANRRAYNTPEQSYTVPDSRVGDIAFDVTLTAKNLGTPQVRNFFKSDFQPRAVVIVRPSQLGRNSTYLITRPGR
jgi:hypothetical protein